MKKFVTVILIIICSLIVVGGGILGGLYIAEYKNPESDIFDRTGTFTVKFGNTEINKIEAQLSVADIELLEGSEWSVRFENVMKDNSSAEVEDKSLKITSDYGKEFDIFGWIINTPFIAGNDGRPVVYVTYPRGAELEDINLQLGLGSCSADGISVNSMVCQTFTGKIELNDTKIKEKSAFQLLAGSFKADNTMFRNSSVKIGAGISQISLDSTSRTADVEVKTTLGFKRFK